MFANLRAMIFSAAFAAVLLYAAYPAYTTVDKKAASQTASLNQLTRWKSEYETLLPIQAEWDKLLVPAAQVNDIDTLLRIVGFPKYGFNVETDKIAVNSPEALEANDKTPLAADRVCLVTAGQPGVVVTADTIYPTLINGLDQLARRKDVEIKSITLTSKGRTATATIGLCLHLRH